MRLHAHAARGAAVPTRPDGGAVARRSPKGGRGHAGLRAAGAESKSVKVYAMFMFIESF